MMSQGRWATFKGFRGATTYIKNQAEVRYVRGVSIPLSSPFRSWPRLLMYGTLACVPRYNEFVFVDTGDNMGAGGLQGAADVGSLGVIEMTLHHVDKRPCAGRPTCQTCAKPKRDAGAGKVAPKLPAAGVNNKKFFEVRLAQTAWSIVIPAASQHSRRRAGAGVQLPSLGSKAGAASTRLGHKKTCHYKAVGPAVAIVKLRYEMADTLRLRQVLDPRNPQHRALLPAAVAAAADAAAVAAVPAGAYTSRDRHRQVTLCRTVDEVGAVMWCGGRRQRKRKRRTQTRRAVGAQRRPAGGSRPHTRGGRGSGACCLCTLTPVTSCVLVTRSGQYAFV